MVTPAADEFVLRLVRDHGLCNDEQIAAARAAAAVCAIESSSSSSRTIVEALIKSGTFDHRQIARVLAKEFGLEFIELASAQPSADALALVPQTLAARYRVLPLRLSGRTLRVALSDPADTDGVDSLAHLTGLTIEPVVATPEDILTSLERFYADEPQGLAEAACAPPLDQGADAFPGDRKATDGDAASDEPIIKIVYALIKSAIQQRASDIHLEPLEKRFRVRYHIDGVLTEAENPPKRLQLAIISRVKLMANISIAEKRVPQDGRIQIVTSGQSVDLRVSSLPTSHGESIVMRILDHRGLQLGFPELGFLADDQARVERLVASPDGIVLVTGPTGSGKTTTLYSCLHHINTPSRKIITVEDPVEYQLSGVNQVPVGHNVGMTFASALRAMLRQAPNIVMIGEIRDLETADIAINAALTGHLVFSTLHTNDAPGAVTRLVDIGVKPFLVSAALRAVVAQRLVRKICQNCARPIEPAPALLRALNVPAEQLAAAHFRQGAGCVACGQTGFRGRMGIYEIFLSTEAIARSIYEGAGSGRLRSEARAAGMRTMREDGIRKASSGLTTIEEVVSITVGDAD